MKFLLKCATVLAAFLLINQFYNTVNNNNIIQENTPLTEYAGEAYSQWSEAVINTKDKISTGLKEHGISFGDDGYVHISSYEQWVQTMESAEKDLMPQLDVCIENFDGNTYKLEKVSQYNLSISAKGEIRGKKAYITYTFTYTDNYMLEAVYENPALADKLNEEQTNVMRFLREKTAQLVNDNMSQYDKEKAIHDFIVANYRYDIEGLEANTLTLRSHSVTGLVSDGKGVCEAYANMFMLMCRMAGLDCTVATGKLNNVDHAWNVICINGEYYHVDVTNDDPAPDVPGRLRYNYFNLDDKEITKTHIIDKDKVKPCNGTMYNYFVYNGLVVENYQQLEELMNREIAAGKTEIAFRTNNFVLNSGAYIREAVSNKGFTKVKTYGEYGRDNVFYVVLE